MGCRPPARSGRSGHQEPWARRQPLAGCRGPAPRESAMKSAIPGQGGSRRANFAHVAPAAPTATNVATWWRGRPKAELPGAEPVRADGDPAEARAVHLRAIDLWYGRRLRPMSSTNPDSHSPRGLLPCPLYHGTSTLWRESII